MSQNVYTEKKCILDYCAFYIQRLIGGFGILRYFNMQRITPAELRPHLVGFNFDLLEFGMLKAFLPQRNTITATPPVWKDCQAHRLSFKYIRQGSISQHNSFILVLRQRNLFHPPRGRTIRDTRRYQSVKNPFEKWMSTTSLCVALLHCCSCIENRWCASEERCT